MPKITTPDGAPWPSITLTLDGGTPILFDADALARLVQRRTPAVLAVAPLVHNTVERIGAIAPLSPMAKIEINAVLTALCDEVAARAEVHAEQERVARRDLGGDDDHERHSDNLRGLTGSH